MKRKLTKANIDELRKEMPVLDLAEEKAVIGGGNLYIMNEDGQIIFKGNTSSNEVIIAIGSIDSGNIIRLPGDTQLTPLKEGGFMITGSGVGKQVFESFAHSTCVEWSLYENSQTGYSAINTSNDYYSIGIYNVPGCDTQYHNHEYSNYPSEADKNSKGYYSNYYIYHEESKTYIAY